MNESLYLKLRPLLLDKEKSIREAVLRVLRYSCVNDQAFLLMAKTSLPMLITRCIERDPKQTALTERFHALKLISYWVETHPQSVPRAFFQSLVAIASHSPEDQLKKPVIEILRLGAVYCTELCAAAGGLNVLVESLIDPGCPEIAESIVMTLIYLINEPKTRACLHAGTDFGYILSIFTDVTGNVTEMKKDPQVSLEQQLMQARKAIVALLKTWNGLIYLTSDTNGLRSLVQALNQPVSALVKRAIFDIFADVLNVSLARQDWEVKSSGENLLNAYLVMVIHAFNMCGLCEVLTMLATSSDGDLAERAQELFKKFTQLSSVLLPEEPRFRGLIELAADFKATNPSRRFRASKALRDLGNSCMQIVPVGPELRKNLSSYVLRALEFTLMTPQGFPYSVQLKGIWAPLRAELDYNIDSTQFAVLLKTTNVPTFPQEDTRWDWRVLAELFESNLQKPARMKEALETKFVRPLLKYFEPVKGKFLDKPWVGLRYDR